MNNACNPSLVSFSSVVAFEMKFKRLLLLSFFALSLMCFTAILLLPRIKERDFLRLPSETLSRYAHKLAVTLSRNSPGLPQSVAKRKTNRRIEWSQASFEAPWNETSGRGNVSDVDLEFQKLLNDTKTQEDEMEDYSDPADSVLAIFQYDELSCTPQNNIAFLKTHKTGSSTLTNILNRYADLREFRLALPAKYFYRFGWPSYFRWNAVDLWRLNGQPANVLCNHARYNRIEMDLIMDNSTKYITILRDPVYQFESTFNYMELYRFFKLENFSNPLEVFLANPGGYLRNLSKPGKPFPESMYLVRNGMFFDLGLHPSYQDNETEIRKAIKRLENDFSLVLMMEYFDESLVLLKREFCWDLDDVAYIKQNQRKSEKSSSKPVLSSWMKEMIRKWNHADVLLYEYFNRTFWERIKQHGPGFYRDLADLKRKNREMYQDCVSPEEVTETAFRLTGKIRGFKLNEGVSQFNRYLCEKLLTNEIDYINYFRQKLNPHAEYQKQLRAKGRAMAPTENIIAKRIRDASDKGLIKVVSRDTSRRVRTS